jgi:hypothetical protein
MLLLIPSEIREDIIHVDGTAIIGLIRAVLWCKGWSVPCWRLGSSIALPAMGWSKEKKLVVIISFCRISLVWECEGMIKLLLRVPGRIYLDGC